MRAQLMAQLRREMGAGEASGTAGRALVAVPDRALAGAITVPLTRQGYGVDTLEDWEEGARLLEQGIYNLVATTRAPAAKGESLFQRMSRLNPEGRRRVFLILIGDEFKTGDGAQAFAVTADLVVNSRDAGSVDAVLRSTLAERTRLYQVFLDARHRFEATAS
jgi:DNA-binding response OmpR family regulator